MPKTNKQSFFKKVIMSIKDFDKYPELASKKNSEVFGYLIKLMAIFTAIVALLSTYKISEKINTTVDYVTQEVPNFILENNTLTLESQEKVQIKKIDNIIDNIIIDSSEITDEKLEEYKTEMKNSNNGILILKNKIILKTNVTESGLIEYSYEELSNNYNIQNLDKQSLLNYFTGSNYAILLVGIYIMLYIYLLIVYIVSVLMDAILLAIIGYITAILLRLRLKIAAMMKIAIHSLTLPIILNLIYIIVQTFTGFKMEYFNIMYIGVAYIYMITCILMIKSDVIKKQQELTKILEEQEKVKQEIEAKKEEEKQKDKDNKEKEKQKDKDNKEEQNREKKKEEKNKKEDKNAGGKEPQGENA